MLEGLIDASQESVDDVVPTRERTGGVRFVTIIWDCEDDPDGNVQHVAEHGLEPADVEFVIEYSESDSTP